MLVTDTAPWDRERESNAHLEDHNLASWPLDDRGHWVAAQGVAPRSPAHEAGMFRLHHAAMEGLEKRGSAGRWGESNSQRRVYWTRARPILASAAGSRNAGISIEKIRGEPRLLTSLSDTTHGGADRVGLLWAALDSPVLLESRGSLQCCGDIPSAGGAGARNCTAISALTERGRDSPATPAMDPPGVGPGSGQLRCPARPLSYGSVDAAGFEPAIGLRRHVKSVVPWTAWLRVRSEPGGI